MSDNICLWLYCSKILSSQCRHHGLYKFSVLTFLICILKKANRHKLTKQLRLRGRRWAVVFSFLSVLITLFLLSIVPYHLYIIACKLLIVQSLYSKQWVSIKLSKTKWKFIWSLYHLSLLHLIYAAISFIPLSYIISIPIRSSTNIILSVRTGARSYRAVRSLLDFYYLISSQQNKSVNNLSCVLYYMSQPLCSTFIFAY